LKAFGDVTRFGGVAAPAQHLVLKLGGESRPLLSKDIEQRPEVRIPVLASSFRSGAEALFGVFAGLDQIVQGSDDVFVLLGHSFSFPNQIAIRWPVSLHFPIVCFSQNPK